MNLSLSHVIKSTNKEVLRVEGEHGNYVQIQANEVSNFPVSLLISKVVNDMINVSRSGETKIRR
ncbi:hypothetical protein HanRHA438_Chr05g0204531 [Helianthus annuus]|nr:hypothetical protein HanRHA438_Chr05g0204531 [Helianthus annuus]